MKKSIFLFFAALLFSASAWAGWCGNSFITVNGLWCTGSHSHVHDGGKFHGKDLGTLTTLELGGEFQVWPSSTTAGTLCYKIDNGTENSISLPKTGTEGDNSKHSGSGAVDLSGLAGGSHSIAVWFKHGSDIDNNGGSNFVATFTIAAATPDPDPTPDPAETETVYFVNAEDWTGTIYAYAFADGGNTKNAGWPGEVAQKEANQIGGHDVYSYTAEKGKYETVIFNNKANGGDKQTADMNWKAGQYICKNEWFVDEAAVLTKLNGPIEYVSVYFINTVKWSAVNIYTWSPEVKTWPGVAMTKEAEQIGGFDVYSYTVEKGTTFGGMKFNENGGNQTGDLQWTDGKYYIYNYGEVVGWFTKEEAEAKLAAPVVTYDYYIAGTEAMTGHNWNPVGLGIEDNDGDGVYSHTFTLDAGGDYQFKVTQDADWDPNWGYSKLDKAYDGVTNSGDDGENIKINLTETKTITVHFDSKAGSISLEGLDSQDKVTYDYYIAGTLPGAAWNPSSLGIELVEGKTDVYEATFDLAANTEYEFKITDGQWNSESDNSHEHTTLAAVYVGVTGGNGINIKVNLAEAKELVITFNATEDRIYLNLDEETTSLTYRVQVPEGTEACYIAGPCNSWVFREMTREGTTNIFTIDIVGAKETDEYKYSCKEDWAYAEVREADENGNSNRKAWTALDEVTEWGKPADPAEVKCYLMGNGDWDNGVEMTLNPDNDNEYMLLDHYISAPFKFKYGEEWSDQVENYEFPGIKWKDSNIELPEGIYDFYFKKDTKKAYIAAVYLRDVTNTWGTICLPHASTSFSGAKFYEVSSLDPTKGLWLDEIEAGTQLVAGKPYVFEATASTIKVTYTDAAVAAPVAGAKGLTGTFTDIAAAAGSVLVGNYIIAQNAVHVATASNDLPAYRAYIANTVPTTEQPQLPGRRRVCMGENAATGLDQIVAPEGQAVKAIVNGQLIIIRDGVKYNVQGQVIR